MVISPTVHQDFIMGLHKLLTDATSKKWEIEIIKGEIGETIADKEKSLVDVNRKNVSEYPLVKKILEEFKGSKIETVIRKNLEQLEEDESENSENLISTTYFDEEE